ncbi:MAG: apolipoprotein N-acyltransferase [Candidatus Accumulibacter sp.]|nr:apolipoprotein N-acyltransferase [Accumulibacter sp.]MCM8595799.1 apolipoprotein N-acyltransferase [Accumulibacter sp.]MCM8626520.1 apolipoprotein N-acyltransferase [Accumulibacter sp.]
MARSFPWRWVASLLLGAASVAAFAPVGWFPVSWLSLGGLFALLCSEVDGLRRPRHGALLALAYGLGLFLSGVSWVYVSLSVFGGMPVALAGLATVLFCAVLAGFPALAGALFVHLATCGWLARALLFAAVWVLTEWLRGWTFTGFPWLAAGYSQTPPSPLAGYAPIFGVYGVSLFCALFGALGHEIGRRWLSTTACPARRWLRWCPLLPILCAAAILLAGAMLHDLRWTEASGRSIRVALLQGNVAQDIKWRPEYFAESLRTYYRLALENPAQLTVMPETALPAFLDQVPVAYLEALRELALREHGDILLGIAIAEGRQYFNAAVSIGASPAQRYRKVHLVPFGEFVPPGFARIMALANIPMSDFSAGSDGQRPLQIAEQRVAVNICYEDAFGEELIGALPEATLLVNLSNVAWFGDSLAPTQHLQIARMRALETGRMMLRATNTGMTAIIDVDGRVRSALPPFSRGALTGEVSGYAGATPFVAWGNWPVIGCALLIVCVCTVARQRRWVAKGSRVSHVGRETK